MKKQEKNEAKTKQVGIQERMLQVTAQCLEEAKGKIGGTLYINDKTNTHHKELDNAVKIFEREFAEENIKQENVVAVFMPTVFNQRKNYLLVTDEGFFWIKTYKDDPKKEPFSFAVSWGDFVIAEVLHKYSSSSNEYMNYFWLNNGTRRSVVLGDTLLPYEEESVKTKKSKSAKEIIESSAYFITHLINRLKDTDVPDDCGAPSVTVARMMEIVAETQESAETDIGGELYLRGAIPAMRLKSVLRDIKDSFDDETEIEKELRDKLKIKKKDIVALYLSTETANKQKCFNRLLFTVRGFYYDVGGRYLLDGFIPWSQIRDVNRTPNSHSFERKKITVLLNCKVLDKKRINLFIPARCEEAVDKFFVPVLKQLSAAVKENAEK